ncbi:Zinc knuckle CX2CX4HX4C [Trema orientale]|uniref:Zinc knuckle CX2CX4HX4C n=1 Tax=Trema orientale TaxID=63057 RepID=A0A2P5FY11_TREOI|nr:Zinc knuckle CX2CX4HX4C [Trema orientale]
MEEELELEVQVDDVDEVSSQVEHISLEDLSFSLDEDAEAAAEAISKTLVGRFLAKRPGLDSLLRTVMGKVWKPKMGWKMQEVEPGYFVFRFTRKIEVEFILENCPWSPCDGFLLLKPMPSNGLWRSADMNTTPIWVRANGFPLGFMTEQNAAKRDYLRFKVDIGLDSPIQAGFSLPRLNALRLWIYFKSERLPITCFRCGIIGHVDQACASQIVKMLNGAGKSVQLYGPWLRAATMEAPEQIRRANPEAYHIPEENPEPVESRPAAETFLSGVEERTEADKYGARNSGTAVSFEVPPEPLISNFGATDIADLAVVLKNSLDPSHPSRPSSSKMSKNICRPKGPKTIRPLHRGSHGAFSVGLHPQNSPKKARISDLELQTKKRQEGEELEIRYSPLTTIRTVSKQSATNFDGAGVEDKQILPLKEVICEPQQLKGDCDKAVSVNSKPNRNFGEAEEAGLIKPPRSS